MSNRTAQLLEAFEALPDDEKRSFAGEILRRSLPFDSGPLEDEEVAKAAGVLSQSLENEEDAASSR